MIETIEALARGVVGAKLQAGEIYAELIGTLQLYNTRMIRVIMPIGFGQMMRCDVIVCERLQNPKITNILFYSKGDKTMEERAINGDKDA